MTQNEIIEAQLKALTIFDANNKCLTVDECAKFLQVHPKTITNRINSKKINAHFVGRIWRIPKMQFIQEIIEEIKRTDF
nr:helix-turn-helix domain-containing protein [uncultured Marinifilum sp.]